MRHTHPTYDSGDDIKIGDSVTNHNQAGTITAIGATGVVIDGHIRARPADLTLLARASDENEPFPT